MPNFTHGQSNFTPLEARTLNAKFDVCDGAMAKIVTLQEALAKAEKANREAEAKMKKQGEQLSTFRKVLINTDNEAKEWKSSAELCQEEKAKEKKKGNAKGWGFGVGCGAVGAGIGLLIGIFAVK